MRTKMTRTKMPGDANDDYDKEWQEGFSPTPLDNTMGSESESVEKDDNNDEDDAEWQRRIDLPLMKKH